MWIKTPLGFLINTDNIFSFYVAKDYNFHKLTIEGFRIIALSGNSTATNTGGDSDDRDETLFEIAVAYFKEAEQAQAYIDKLAEKLGAEVIECT